MSKEPVGVGKIRPSQLLSTCGPGALIDLPNISVITMGIDYWEKNRCQPIYEARLLANVQAALGSQVKSLRMPPISDEEIVNPFAVTELRGVPVNLFPRWLRCVQCGLLSPYDAGLFRLKENPYRPELTRFVHEGCRGSSDNKKARDADAVPARFLFACRAGHLDDFPWSWFVHDGDSTCRGTLRFFESGASLQTENLWVKCDTCGASKNMAQAFWKSNRDNLPACRGRHPHMDQYDDECSEDARVILLGATNSWFYVMRSALAIPQNDNLLGQLIADGWKFFQNTQSADGAAIVADTLIEAAQLPDLKKFTSKQIWSAIEAHRNGETNVKKSDIKGPEWNVLTAESPPTDHPNFLSKKEDVPTGFDSEIDSVLLLERLREVKALLGFTRVESPDEQTTDEAVPRAPLGHAATDWVPATEVHGEGIFIRFNSNALKAWEKKDAVIELSNRLQQGHKGWRQKRNLDPNDGCPSVRYIMLHTLAHMLMRELALECGYNAASIRERIYASTDDGQDQSGFLIYTAAADSDGTLGGLVELGKSKNLGRLLHQALYRACICASDPLCSEHDPGKDQSLHGAACHACSFVSETSCERGNRYLDRSFVVSTLEHPDAAFFKIAQ